MGSEKRKLSVFEALVWAFRDEKAQLTLPDHDGLGDHHRSYGTEYVLLERLKLGNVRIDTSPGRSSPADDADILSDYVSNLPNRLGGVTMAILLAQYSRSETVPDCMEGMSPKIEPLEWKRGNQFQRMAKTKVLRRYVDVVKTAHPKNPRRMMKRKVERVDEVCPCRWNPSLDEIQAAREHYERWWLSLGYIRLKATGEGRLRRIELTEEMPRARPWLM